MFRLFGVSTEGECRGRNPCGRKCPSANSSLRRDYVTPNARRGRPSALENSLEWRGEHSERGNLAKSGIRIPVQRQRRFQCGERQLIDAQRTSERIPSSRGDDRRGADDDPGIAPDLVPLRKLLMAMVKRPVNIQGTRDIVMYLRGELIGQPYLTLIGKNDE